MNLDCAIHILSSVRQIVEHRRNAQILYAGQTPQLKAVTPHQHHLQNAATLHVKNGGFINAKSDQSMNMFLPGWALCLLEQHSASQCTEYF